MEEYLSGAGFKVEYLADAVVWRKGDVLNPVRHGD
jgi:hypothetical protein